MDRLDSIRRSRAAELLAELRTRMQTESPESLGAFVARGLELGSLREDVMHALRTDPELRALAPEVRPRVFELFAPGFVIFINSFYYSCNYSNCFHKFLVET